MGRDKDKRSSRSPLAFDQKRDAYGFAVRPQHLQRYREYANIYKEEEEERSDKWSDFLKRQADSAQLPLGSSQIEKGSELLTDARILGRNELQENVELENDAALHVNANGVSLECQDLINDPVCDHLAKLNCEEDTNKQEKVHRIQIWTHIRPSLSAIEDMMSYRVKKRSVLSKKPENREGGNHLPVILESKPTKLSTDDDSDEEFYDVEKSDAAQDGSFTEFAIASGNRPSPSPEPFFPWKEELESLVRGGVPMALRGELWQAFVGVRTRRVKNYYQDLLASGVNGIDQELDGSPTEEVSNGTINGTEKWKGQIEKDLPRTFPGHPALDEDGRSALRRLLTAYARHNPSVGYCQAMNFFAGLLLLLMPEENAFWALTGIIDNYFSGYYTEEMVESQVDQFVFMEIMREKFPKLVNHLDFLGVEVAWVTGPWFLSIFVNMLPWESVLRVWDVLLFEGNRVMLFRTALALMELYGPALATTKDAGDAITLLQSLAGSTFDSSQLVLTACMGFQVVKEEKLQELRLKHRPAVLAILEERAKGLSALRDSQGLASKLYSFKNCPESIVPTTEITQGLGDLHLNKKFSLSPLQSKSLKEYFNSLNETPEADIVPDLWEQAMWLKDELCRLLEEKRSANLRAEELETALMEMVKQDNRRFLTARVERLEHEIDELQLALSGKREQEHAMLQILMRVEQEQKVTEDARRYAEQEATAQRYSVNILEEKYEEAMASLAEMEKRAVMAESVLEATLQYQSSQGKALQSPVLSPRTGHQQSSPTQHVQEQPARRVGLLARPFGFGWHDKNKEKLAEVEEMTESKPMMDSKLASEGQCIISQALNGHQEPGKVGNVEVEV